MKLPTNEKDRQILAEFIQKYHTHQWLRGANVIEMHPTRLCKTLEVAVNYRPVRELADILDFCAQRGIALEFLTVDDQR